jgi:2-oxoglutarate dehydrogenase complex dehydrogenase (E1) component-like enzyme
MIENHERELVFGLFRQFGYLEAELDPLRLLPPQPHPDLQIDNEWAREARRMYCGSVGVEFMHIADPERRRWIQQRIEAEPAEVDRERAFEMSRRSSNVISAANASHSKAVRPCCPRWMWCWT